MDIYLYSVRILSRRLIVLREMAFSCCGRPPEHDVLTDTCVLRVESQVRKEQNPPRKGSIKPVSWQKCAYAKAAGA